MCAFGCCWPPQPPPNAKRAKDRTFLRPRKYPISRALQEVRTLQGETPDLRSCPSPRRLSEQVVRCQSFVGGEMTLLSSR